jgi:hypothetical protein
MDGLGPVVRDALAALVLGPFPRGPFGNAENAVPRRQQAILRLDVERWEPGPVRPLGREDEEKGGQRRKDRTKRGHFGAFT